MKPYRFLDQDKQVQDYLISLRERDVQVTAVDLEGEFNLHHYGEHLCLVQIFDGRDSVIIDPQTVRISLIKEFFEDPSLKKIFYDCSGDRTLLYRQYGISLTAVIDLLPAVELLELEKKGLGKVLTAVLGLEEKNKKKFQRYNWMKRPIREDALVYAIEDVEYLYELKEKLMSDIEKRGLFEEYERLNHEVQSKPVALEAVPGLFKKNRFKKLPPEAKELFRELYYVRDEYAQRMDLPPNSVIANEDLYGLSLSRMASCDIAFSRQVSQKFIPSLLKDVDRVLSRNPAHSG